MQFSCEEPLPSLTMGLSGLNLKPFKISTFKNAHWFCTHMVIFGSKLYYHSNPFKSILEGPLIHHLEVSKQGFVLAVLPFGKIHPNKVLY